MITRVKKEKTARTAQLNEIIIMQAVVSSAEELLPDSAKRWRGRFEVKLRPRTTKGC